MPNYIVNFDAVISEGKVSSKAQQDLARDIGKSLKLSAGTIYSVVKAEISRAIADSFSELPKIQTRSKGRFTGSRRPTFDEAVKTIERTEINSKPFLQVVTASKQIRSNLEAAVKPFTGGVTANTLDHFNKMSKVIAVAETRLQDVVGVLNQELKILREMDPVNEAGARTISKRIALIRKELALSTELLATTKNTFKDFGSEERRIQNQIKINKLQEQETLNQRKLELARDVALRQLGRYEEILRSAAAAEGRRVAFRRGPEAGQAAAGATFAALERAGGSSVAELQQLAMKGSEEQIFNLNRQLAQQIPILQKVATATRKSANEFEQHAFSSRKFGEAAALAIKRYSAYLIPTTGLFAVISAVRNSISTFAEFEKQLTSLEQVLELPKDQISGLGDEFIRMSRTFGIAVTELGESARFFAQAGFGRGPGGLQEIVSLVEGIAKTNLAATFDDATKTSEGLLAILAQFNLKGTETARVLDTINQLSKDFAVESSDILEAVKRGGAVIAATGGRFEDFAKIMTLVRSSTRQSASTLGSFIKTIGIRIFAKNREEFLRELDPNILLQDTSIGRLQAISDAIFGGKSSLATGEQIRFGSDIAGVRQAQSFIALLKAMQTEGDRVDESLGKAFGSIDRDVAKRIDDVGKSFDRLRQSINNTLLEIINTDAVKTVAKFVADIGTTVANLVGTLAPVIGGVLVASLGLAAPKIGGFIGGLTQRFGLRSGGGLDEAASLGTTQETAAINRLMAEIVNVRKTVAEVIPVIRENTGATAANTSSRVASISGQAMPLTLGGTPIPIQGRRLFGLEKGGLGINTTSRDATLRELSFAAGLDASTRTRLAEDSIITQNRDPKTRRFQAGFTRLFFARAPSDIAIPPIRDLSNDPATKTFANASATERARALQSAGVPLTVRQNALANSPVLKGVRSLAGNPFGLGLAATVAAGFIPGGINTDSQGRQSVSGGQITRNIVGSAGTGLAIGSVFGPLGAALLGTAGAAIGLATTFGELNKVAKENAQLEIARFNRGDKEASQNLVPSLNVLAEDSIGFFNRLANIPKKTLDTITLDKNSSFIEQQKNLSVGDNILRAFFPILRGADLFRSNNLTEDFDAIDALGIDFFTNNGEKVLLNNNSGLTDSAILDIQEKIGPVFAGILNEAVIRSGGDIDKALQELSGITGKTPEQLKEIGLRFGALEQSGGKLIPQLGLLNELYEESRKNIEGINTVLAIQNKLGKEQSDAVVEFAKSLVRTSSDRKKLFDGTFVPRQEEPNEALLRNIGTVDRELNRLGLTGIDSSRFKKSEEEALRLTQEFTDATAQGISGGVGNDFLDALEAFANAVTHNQELLEKAAEEGATFDRDQLKESQSTVDILGQQIKETAPELFKKITEGTIGPKDLAGLRGSAVVDFFREITNATEEYEQLLTRVGTAAKLNNFIFQELAAIQDEKIELDNQLLESQRKIINQSKTFLDALLSRSDALNRTSALTIASRTGINAISTINSALSTTPNIPNLFDLQQAFVKNPTLENREALNRGRNSVQTFISVLNEGLAEGQRAADLLTQTIVQQQEKQRNALLNRLTTPQIELRRNQEASDAFARQLRSGVNPGVAIRSLSLEQRQRIIPELLQNEDRPDARFAGLPIKDVIDAIADSVKSEQDPNFTFKDLSGSFGDLKDVELKLIEANNRLIEANESLRKEMEFQRVFLENEDITLNRLKESVENDGSFSLSDLSKSLENFANAIPKSIEISSDDFRVDINISQPAQVADNIAKAVRAEIDKVVTEHMKSIKNVLQGQ